MKKHSSWISALMAAVLTLVLAVSSSQPAQASGTLKIGMEANYAIQLDPDHVRQRRGQDRRDQLLRQWLRRQDRQDHR